MNINKNFLRWIGGYFLLDGILTLLFGRKYAKLYRVRSKRSPYRKMMDRLMGMPNRQLKGAGAAEAALGLAVLSRVPMEVTAFYRLVASGYAAIDPGWREWFYPRAHDAFDELLIDNLREGGDILDLGCGVGANLARITAMDLPYSSYVGVDITEAMLEKAQQRYGNLPNMKFERLDLLVEPLPKGLYNLIISTWVFEHLSDPVRVAGNAWERLRLGGQMILLIETQGRSLPNMVISLIYPLIGAHRIRENEYRQFPGQVMPEKHFPGPLGNLTLLVLKKTT